MNLNPDPERPYDIVICDFDSVIFRAGFGAPPGSPVEHSLHNVKNQVEKVLNLTNAESYVIYLGGTGNFRYDLATIRPYKGKRDDRKPEWFTEMREYLANTYGAEFVDGIEADDACATEHMKALGLGLNPVLAHIDKDLDMVPGWHFNFNKEKFYWVDEIDGLRWFYKQMLIGDSTDNIPGIDGVGKIKSEQLLGGLTNQIEMEELVADLYKKQYGNRWLESMTEVGNLLWMRREPNQVWTPTAR